METEKKKQGEDGRITSLVVDEYAAIFCCHCMKAGGVQAVIYCCETFADASSSPKVRPVTALEACCPKPCCRCCPVKAVSLSHRGQPLLPL